MSPNASPDKVRRWIASRLDPLDATILGGMEGRADLSLDPAHRSDDTVAWKPAAVLVGLIERAHGLQVLLTRRADTLRSHTGQVAFPGGRCDPGETPWETALREAEEEVGLERRFVSLAGLSTPMLTHSGYMITPVVGFIREGFQLAPNPQEVADIFETPFGFLMDPANYEEHTAQLEDGLTRRYYGTTHQDRYIWGVTAGILRQLYERLYGAAVA